MTTATTTTFKVYTELAIAVVVVVVVSGNDNKRKTLNYKQQTLIKVIGSLRSNAKANSGTGFGTRSQWGGRTDGQTVLCT